MATTKNPQRVILYSEADWRFHGNKLGYDDLVDKSGRLVATIGVMDIAKDEMFNDVYIAGDIPKEIFVREKDGCWSIYLDVRWLTPHNVEKALIELGRLSGKEFKFEPYILPAQLAKRYRKFAEKSKREIERTKTSGKPVDLEEFLGLGREKKLLRVKGRPRMTKKLPARRLAEILTHKLKF